MEPGWGPPARLVCSWDLRRRLQFNGPSESGRRGHQDVRYLERRCRLHADIHTVVRRVAVTRDPGRDSAAHRAASQSGYDPGSTGSARSTSCESASCPEITGQSAGLCGAIGLPNGGPMAPFLFGVWAAAPGWREFTANQESGALTSCFCNDLRLTLRLAHVG